MRLSFLLLFLYGINIQVFGQSFEIHAIQSSGIRLENGWKWMPEDNPEYKNQYLNDKDWRLINPAMDIMQFDKINSSAVSWFRFHFNLKDSTLIPLLIIKQTGASEIYLNGELLAEFGKIDRLSQVFYDPQGEILTLKNLKKENVLAIRFAKPNTGLLVKNFYFENPTLKIWLSDSKNVKKLSQNITGRTKSSSLSGFFKSGIFFILSLSHLLLFFIYPKQKANLYFGAFALLNFSLMVTENLSLLNLHIIYTRNILSAICMFLHPLAELLAFISVYYWLKLPKNHFFYLTVVISILCMPLMLRPYQTGTVLGLLIPSLWIGIAVPIISWKAYKKGQKGAYGLVWAGIIFIINYTAYIFTINYLRDTSYYSFITEITFSSSLLALPFALSYYLAVEFAERERKIEKSMNDFKHLSIENEKIISEKKTDLIAALLEGQTKERKRVALDLHDNLGGTLSSLRWSLGALDTHKFDPKENEIYTYVQKTLDKAYEQIRLLSHNLAPDELAQNGLWEALKLLTYKLDKSSPIKFILVLPAEPVALNTQTQFEIYNICLELANNVLKHANATETTIVFKVEGQYLQLTFSDNGVGFPENNENGKGLKNIKDRTHGLNGNWELIRNIPSGTKHLFLFPI